MIGIGNPMRGDDCAGIEAVAAWAEKHPVTANQPDVRILTIREPALDLLQALDPHGSAILVDAVLSGAQPGSVHRFSLTSIAGIRTSSAHALPVAELLQLAAALRILPGDDNVRIIGIEASQTEMGAALSAEVRAALPKAIDMIDEEVRALLTL